MERRSQTDKTSVSAVPASGWIIPHKNPGVGNHGTTGWCVAGAEGGGLGCGGAVEDVGGRGSENYADAPETAENINQVNFTGNTAGFRYRAQIRVAGSASVSIHADPLSYRRSSSSFLLFARCEGPRR